MFRKGRRQAWIMLSRVIPSYKLFHPAVSHLPSACKNWLCLVPDGSASAQGLATASQPPIPHCSPTCSYFTCQRRSITRSLLGYAQAQGFASPRRLPVQLISMVPKTLRHQSSSREGDGGQIQPLNRSLNHFQILGMPNMHFDLDPKVLDQRYKQLQWQFHPDKASLRPKQEQEWAADHATAINRAYSILKSPLSRATYMLAQLGINLDGEDAATISDPELLMEIMDAREEVEQTSDVPQLMDLLQKNREKQTGLFTRLSSYFRSNDLQAAKGIATELIYLDRLERAVLEKLPVAA